MKGKLQFHPRDAILIVIICLGMLADNSYTTYTQRQLKTCWLFEDATTEGREQDEARER